MTDAEIIELYREQIQYLNAENQRLKLLARTDAIGDHNSNLTHEWRVTAPGYIWPEPTFTEANQMQRFIARKCDGIPDPIVQHRLVTPWKEITE